MARIPPPASRLGAGVSRIRLVFYLGYDWDEVTGDGDLHLAAE
jgi:hypothetical protein